MRENVVDMQEMVTDLKESLHASRTKIQEVGLIAL
jgi:hypothetical protein